MCIILCIHKNAIYLHAVRCSRSHISNETEYRYMRTPKNVQWADVVLPNKKHSNRFGCCCFVWIFRINLKLMCKMVPALTRQYCLWSCCQIRCNEMQPELSFNTERRWIGKSLNASVDLLFNIFVWRFKLD